MGTIRDVELVGTTEGQVEDVEFTPVGPVAVEVNVKLGVVPVPEFVPHVEVEVPVVLA
jgi:hypothetical protein